MRLAPVLTQAMQHRRQWTSGRCSQSQCGQRVGRVVPPTYAKRIQRHEALDVQDHLLVFAPLHRLVGFDCPDQPSHTVSRLNAVVARAHRLVRAKSNVVAQLAALDERWQRRHHERITTVEQHQSAAEDARLGRRVGRQRAVPVKMVLRHVKDRRHAGFEIAAAVQLEARQFKHPHLRQALAIALRIEFFGERVQQGRADIASHSDRLACVLHQQARERGHGGFTVRSGDADDFRRVSFRRLQVCKGLRKQTEFVAAQDSGSSCSSRQRSDCCRRQTRTFQHQVKRTLLKQGFIKCGMDENRRRYLHLQCQ